MPVFRSKPSVAVVSSTFKSVDEMRRELKDTLSRLDRGTQKSQTVINKARSEQKAWSGRMAETDALMEATDSPEAKEALQLLRIQAGNYHDYFLGKAKSETEKYAQLSMQAEELHRAINRLEVEDMKVELHKEISATEATIYDKAVVRTTTVSAESEREVQRLIFNAEALLEIKGNADLTKTEKENA